MYGPLSWGGGSAPPQVSTTFEERTIPISCLGKGKTSAVQKARNLIHSASLEIFPGEGNFDTWRMSVRCVTSDLGVERSLHNMALLRPGRIADMERVAVDQHVRHFVWACVGWQRYQMTVGIDSRNLYCVTTSRTCVR